MTFSQKNRLAHEMGANYENGRWYFPSPQVKEDFLRKTNGDASEKPSRCNPVCPGCVNAPCPKLGAPRPKNYHPRG